MLFKKACPCELYYVLKTPCTRGWSQSFLLLSYKYILYIIMLYINNRSGHIYIFKLLNKDCPTKIGHRSKGTVSRDKKHDTYGTRSY